MIRPIEHLPHACGVYLMRDSSGQIIYVGKANDLAKRVSQYFDPSRSDPKTALLVPLIRLIDYVPCASEREALLLERRLIRRHQPSFNSMWKDDKSYPYVRLSLHEDFPRLSLTRSKRRDGAAYFGPYPKAATVKSLLRHLWERRIFPLRPCRWNFSIKAPLPRRKIQSCLYYHTRQCPAPCAGRIAAADYRRIAENAALFFKGEFAALSKEWSAEMKAAAGRLDFERAARLRDGLSALGHMRERVRTRAVGAKDLAERLLSSRGVTELQRALSLPRPPHHVEAFDVSHFSGKQTVASMVCFQGGEPYKDHYRRFRIRTVPGIDDFHAMEEVVSRRYRRLRGAQEALPDLILIDGGKGQLAAAQRALQGLKLELPMAALAKRLEEIFLPQRPDALRLDLASPALQLLQRLRDEAHRFAVTYHKLLRHKRLMGLGA
ncbi:MAG: excinuclease ABC subunit UvrC [Elusimicrobia bacterium]|nr:excinuclease ABC subunit UvrC [Elusimicrobiota bacterium]